MNTVSTSKFVDALDFFPPDAGDGLQTWSSAVCQLRFCAETFMREEGDPRCADEVAEMVLELNDRGAAVRVLTEGVYSDLLAANVERLHAQNQFGLAVVPYAPRAEVQDVMFDAIDRLHQLSDIGCFTWAAIDRLPTPDVYSAASNLDDLLSELYFVDEIVFSRSHEHACIAYSLDHPDFYERVEHELLEWCRQRNIGLHFERELESVSRTPIRVSDLFEQQ